MTENQKVNVIISVDNIVQFGVDIEWYALPRKGDSISWVSDEGKKAFGEVGNVFIESSFIKGVHHCSKVTINVCSPEITEKASKTKGHFIGTDSFKVNMSPDPEELI